MSQPGGIQLRRAVLALLCATSAFPLLSIAQPANDYGAETVEPATEKDPNVNALPVELVEDRDGEDEPSPAKPAVSEKPAATEATSPARPAPSPARSTPEEEPQLPYNRAQSATINGVAVSNEATTLLNVRDVDIAALIKSFSKLTNRNYILDAAVKGKVTILLPSPVTISEALRILDSVLLLKGFTTVPVEKNTWKVIPAKEARQTTIPILADSPDQPSDALVTQIIRLKNVQAQDLQQALSQFVSKEGLVNAFPGTNSLIVIDSAANIERLTRLARELDVPAVDQDITIIPILYAEAKDIAEKINQLLGENEQSKTQALNSLVPRIPVPTNVPAGIPGSPPGVISPVAATTGGPDRGRRSLPVKVIPDERTNSLVVVADPTTTLKIRGIVEQLDSQTDKSGGRFYVYKLKYADAEELGDVLSALITGSPASGEGRGSRSTGSSISRSERDRDRSGSGSGSRFGGSSRSRRGAGSTREDRGTESPSRSGGGNVITASPGDKDTPGRVNFEGEVSIAPDPSTNSLIINASRSDFLKIKQVIEELDVKRRQVVVEATILEVSLDENTGMGVELQGTGATDEIGVIGQTNFGGITNILSNPAALTDLTVAAASTGTLTLPGGLVIPSQAVLVSAVSKHRNVNVLSTPTIVTTDNQEAEIIVGENVPFVTSQSTDTSNLGNTFTQIERQDVGITLRITPQVSAGQFVSLKMFVEISNVVPETRNASNGPTTTIRTTETNVDVKDGQMVVTGGLISDNVTEAARGVPYFEDIPVLGNLFRRDDRDRRRTNLLIFITPRILKDQFDARENTIVRRDHLNKVIREHNAEPPRHEILESEDIDRVTESLPTREVNSPGITPPSVPVSLDKDAEAALSRTQERLQSMMGSAARSGTKPPPLEISVRPKLPVPPREQSPEARARRYDAPLSAATARSGVAEDEGAPPESETPLTGDMPAEPPADSSAGREAGANYLSATTEGSSYVVLMEMGREDGQHDTVGIVVPPVSLPRGNNFFAVGRRYRYNENGTEKQFVCLGKYASATEAERVHGKSRIKGSWRELTVKEALTLGTGSWKQG